MRATVLTALFVVTLVSDAFAQQLSAPRVQPALSLQAPPPSFEFGGHFDWTNLAAGEPAIGARFSRRRHDWLFTEFTYNTNVDLTKSSTSFRKSRMFMASVRLQEPRPQRVERLFVTAGLAAASGLSYTWSPMVGVGLQIETEGGLAALRVELQYFPRAARPRAYEGQDLARVLAGFTLGVR